MEASERSMLLPDDDKDSVGRMIHWLYTKKIDLTIPICAETSAECYMQLAKLNTFAEKYDIYLLKNDIVDELFGLKNPPKHIKPPQMPVVKHVYDNTTARSSFRKLMVAWYAYHVDRAWYDEDDTRVELPKVSQDFAIDLALALGTILQNSALKSPFTRPKETFYEKPLMEADGECS